MVEIENLKEVGLTEYESKAYLSLLKHGAQTGREVFEGSGVPQPRVYDVLRSLVDKGLASLIRKEQPMLFKPIEPEIGLKKLFNKKIKKMKFFKKKTLESLENLEKKEKKSEIKEKVTVIFGFEKMYDYFVENARGTRKELAIFSVGEEVPLSVKKTMKGVVDRGVKARFIATKFDEENKKILKEFKEKLGFKVKHYPTTQEYTFGVFDGRSCMLDVRNPKKEEERVSIFFKIKGLSKALLGYFDILWEKARPVEFS